MACSLYLEKRADFVLEVWAWACMGLRLNGHLEEEKFLFKATPGRSQKPIDNVLAVELSRVWGMCTPRITTWQHPIGRLLAASHAAPLPDDCTKVLQEDG